MPRCPALARRAAPLRIGWAVRPVWAGDSCPVQDAKPGCAESGHSREGPWKESWATQWAQYHHPECSKSASACRACVDWCAGCELHTHPTVQGAPNATCPTLWAVKRMLQRWFQQGQLFAYFDLHAHAVSATQNCVALFR